MDKLSYRRHRFPSIVIQRAVWLYFRFALSYREVEDMLAERGIDVSSRRSSDGLAPRIPGRLALFLEGRAPLGGLVRDRHSIKGRLEISQFIR